MPHPTTPKLAVIRYHAERYGITERTAYRYEKSGVDLADPAAVAIHISGLKHPAPKALDAVAEILRTELNS